MHWLVLSSWESSSQSQTSSQGCTVSQVDKLYWLECHCAKGPKLSIPVFNSELGVFLKWAEAVEGLRDKVEILTSFEIQWEVGVLSRAEGWYVDINLCCWEDTLQHHVLVRVSNVLKTLCPGNPVRVVQAMKVGITWTAAPWGSGLEIESWHCFQRKSILAFF